MRKNAYNLFYKITAFAFFVGAVFVPSQALATVAFTPDTPYVVSEPFDFTVEVTCSEGDNFLVYASDNSLLATTGCNTFLSVQSSLGYLYGEYQAVECLSSIPGADCTITYLPDMIANPGFISLTSFVIEPFPDDPIEQVCVTEDNVETCTWSKSPYEGFYWFFGAWTFLMVVGFMLRYFKRDM